MVPGEPPLTQHRQDQGAGGGFQETEQRTHTHLHRQDTCGAGVNSFKFPLRSHHRGSHMVCSHRRSAEEGTSAPLLPETAEEVWNEPQHPQILLHLHCGEHPDRLHHRLVWKQHRWQPKSSAKGCAKLPATLFGGELPSLQDIYTRRCIRKARRIIKDSSHPSHRLLSLLPSGRRLRSIRSRTSRLRDSFSLRL